MCLSTAYGKKGDESSVLCKNVSKVDIGADSVTLYDLFGSEIVVPGKLISIDLMENTVIIDCA